jgi:hypothetical protein
MDLKLHYSMDGIHHLDFIDLKDNILRAYDLGMTRSYQMCNCNLGRDHCNNVRYKLEQIPSLSTHITCLAETFNKRESRNFFMERNQKQTNKLDDDDFN